MGGQWIQSPWIHPSIHHRGWHLTFWSRGSAARLSWSAPVDVNPPQGFGSIRNTTDHGLWKRKTADRKHEIWNQNLYMSEEHWFHFTHESSTDCNGIFFFHDTFPKLMFSGKTYTRFGVRAEYSSAFFHRSFVLKLLLWGSYKDFFLIFFNVSALVFQLAAFSLAAFMMQLPADHRCWRILTPWIMPHNAVTDNELVPATLAFIWSVSVFSRAATTKNLSERDAAITEADLKEQKPFPPCLFPLPRNALRFDFCQGEKKAGVCFHFPQMPSCVWFKPLLWGFAPFDWSGLSSFVCFLEWRTLT